MSLTREEQAELVRRADRLSSLMGNQAGWAEMEATVARECDRLRKTAMRIALSPEGADQRALDVIRGTIKALRFFVIVPKNAQADLVRFMREQGIEMEDEIPVEQL